MPSKIYEHETATGRLVLIGLAVLAIVGMAVIRFSHSSTEGPTVISRSLRLGWKRDSSALELVVSRYRRIQEASPEPWTDHATTPGVAVMFLTLRGLDNPSVWERWFQDGFESLRQRGLETRDATNPLGPDDHPSDVLRAYVHAPPFMNQTIVKRHLPPTLRPGLVKDAASCAWGVLNPCTARMLQTALDDHPTAQWFFLVSSDAVPTKSFEYFYDRLLADRRSRVSWAALNFDEGLPKFCNWLLLSREHAEILNKRQSEWTGGYYHGNYTHQAAATDETLLMKPLIDAQGEDVFTRFAPGPFLLPWHLKPFGEMMWSLACWNPECTWLGDHASVPRYPWAYANFSRAGIETLVREPTLFTVRKVTKNGFVHKCPEMKNMAPKTDQIKTSTSQAIPEDEKRRMSQENWTLLGPDEITMKEPYFLAPVWTKDTKRQRANDPEANTDEVKDCTLLDFLTWRLNLKSRAIFEPPEATPFLLPSAARSASMTYEKLIKILKEQDPKDMVGLRNDL